LWRCSIPWDDIDLPLLLPVIRDGRVKWEEWDERRFKHEPCILVPFFAPFKMTLTHSLPIVGVPRRVSSTPRKAIPQIEKVQALVLHEEFTAGTTAPAVNPKERIAEGYTHLLHSLARYDKAAGKWEKVRSELGETDEIRAAMQPCDRHHGNTWLKYGFQPDKDESWDLAYACFGAPARDPGKIKTFTVEVPRHQWNAAESKTDMGLMMMLKMMKVFGGWTDD
jgi:hypothetical protein